MSRATGSISAVDAALLFIVVVAIAAAFLLAERREAVARVIVSRGEGLTTRRPLDRDGNLHGYWWTVDAEGRLIEEGEVEHGLTIWQRFYYPSGALRAESREDENYLLHMRNYAEDGTPLD